MQSRCFLCLRHKFLILPLQSFGKFISTTQVSSSIADYCRSRQDVMSKCPLRDKCALITGGTSGVGLECAKALLALGCKGVTLADGDEAAGESALRCICEKFGNNKAVFLKCDCTKPESIDWAFKNTIRVFDRLDIVISNASVLNDKQWEKNIVTNINGSLITSLLGLQYMSCTCQGSGGVVINIASIMGVTPFHGCPIYSMTQSAILGLTRSLGGGCHVQRTGVRIMGLCIGLTDECALKKGAENAINDKFSKEFVGELRGRTIQETCAVGEALRNVLEDDCSGNVWMVDKGGPACKLRFPCVEEMMATCCSVPSKTSNKC